jgi:hypothetical protein
LCLRSDYERLENPRCARHARCCQQHCDDCIPTGIVVHNFLVFTHKKEMSTVADELKARTAARVVTMLSPSQEAELVASKIINEPRVETRVVARPELPWASALALAVSGFLAALMVRH